MLHKYTDRLNNDSDPNPLGSYSGRWCLDGALRVAAYAAGSPAWVGRTTPFPERGGSFPHLDELARLASAAGDSPPTRVPYSFLTMKNTLPGTRFTFSTGDVPPYPAPFTVTLHAPPPHKETWRQPQSPPHNYRLCGKKTVVLGNRALLLGGQAEGTA